MVAANLVERAWAVMDRGMPYVICDIDGRPVTPEEAKAVIAENWTVPADVRARRRSKKAGKAPKKFLAGRSRPRAGSAGNGATFPGEHRRSLAPAASSELEHQCPEEEPLDDRSSIAVSYTHLTLPTICSV